MVVTALRDSDHTFDTTPWPTHVTLDNFADALATDKGNDFVGAIVNSLLISLATTGLESLHVRSSQQQQSQVSARSPENDNKD